MPFVKIKKYLEKSPTKKNLRKFMKQFVNLILQKLIPLENSFQSKLVILTTKSW